MELKKDYPVSVLRTLTRYNQLFKETDRVNKELLYRALGNVHSEFTSNMAIELLLSDGLVRNAGEWLYPGTENKGFDWLKNLLTKVPSVLVLGFPGSHTLVMMEELEKRGLQYIDHDAAWRSLMENAESSIDIISPFIDPDGIEIFASDLIKALKKGVNVKVITRSFDPGTRSQKRSAIESLVRRVESEYRSANLSFGYFHDGSMEDRTKPIGSVHAKLLIQDNRVAYVGSGEFRKNSAFLNLEVGFVSTIPSEISSLVTVFDVFWNLCDVRKWSEAI